MQVAPGAPSLTLYDRFTLSLDLLLAPVASGTRLAVALSGGADSMALALLAHRYATAHGHPLTCLTVDHRLRAASTPEAAQVAHWMGARGIPHHILTPEHRFDSNNLQHAAREWRYHALSQWCRQQDVLHCLLGHHAGDQRETAALMQNRGDTEDGPSGMPACRNHEGVRFLRPLLHIEKYTLEAYLNAEQQPWVNDPSNHNLRFARARLRQAGTALPIAPTIHTERTQRDRAVADAATTCLTLHPSGHALLHLEAWQALPEPLATQLLADVLRTIGGQVHRPRKAETLRLTARLRAPGFTRATLHHCLLRLRAGLITIAREPARVAPPLILEGQGKAAWDGRFTVHYRLPPGLHLTLAALGPNRHNLPESTPAIWHLDEPAFLPHIEEATGRLPAGVSLTLGFTPPKPLAAAPFWWLN